MFALLQQIDGADTPTLAAVWSRLRNFLEAHAAAEERHFYPCLLQRGDGAADAPDVASETRDAIKDHNEIRNAARAVDAEATGSRAWRKAVTAAETANSDHMAEEERQGLADFRQNTGLELRHSLAIAFLRFELDHLDGVTPSDPDPERYVREGGPPSQASAPPETRPPQPSHDEASRAFEHGSSGSTADLAVEGRPDLQDRFTGVAYAHAVEPLAAGPGPDQLAEKVAVEAQRNRPAHADGDDADAPEGGGLSP